MKGYIEINSRRLALGEPVYVVADKSANRGRDFEMAVKILRTAKEAGADAVKL